MSLVTFPRQFLVDVNGSPRVGAKAYAYQSSTTTPITTYTTAAYAVANSNPVLSVAGGFFPAVYVDPSVNSSYKLVIKDSADVTLYTEDNIPALGFTQADIGSTLYPRTAAEISAGVTPVNYFYPPGYVYRYGTNTVPGTTDMTTAHNNAATAARAGNYTVVLGVNCLVSSALNFSNVRVTGPGTHDPNNAVYNIIASSAQFSVITCTGQASFDNFSVNGGWNGVTAGQTGDVFSFTNPVSGGGNGFAYNIHLTNIRIDSAKRCMIYWEGGGYSSVYSVRGLNAGLHGIELNDGVGSAFVSTTVAVGGQSVFSGTPNGYGAKIVNGVSIAFRDVIMEVTKGILITGNNNRSLTFDNVYQELTTGLKFLDFNGTGSGIGLTVANCFGGGAAIDPVSSWQEVHFHGNSLLTEPPLALTGAVYQNDGGELITSTTGGVSVTAASVSLDPGLYLVTGTLQTVTSTASTLTQVGCVLTSNVASTGLATGTSTFEEGAGQANYNPGALLDQRLNCQKIVRVTATTTYYLRARLIFSGAGNLAYRGVINAVKIH
jgi:hypothetical protein